MIISIYGLGSVNYSPLTILCSINTSDIIILKKKELWTNQENHFTTEWTSWKPKMALFVIIVKPISPGIKTSSNNYSLFIGNNAHMLNSVKMLKMTLICYKEVLEKMHSKTRISKSSLRNIMLSSTIINWWNKWKRNQNVK